MSPTADTSASTDGSHGTDGTLDVTVDAVAVRGWWPVARSADITATPVPVRTGDREWVAFRPSAGEPAGVVEARCPHRLVRLAHGTVVEGRLQCPYHGWRFDPDGACALVPSNGPEVSVPPRADLAVPWGVRERDGVLWVAPVDPSLPVDGAAGASAADERGSTDTLTNLDASLERGWHPLALTSEVGDGPDAHLDVALLGRAYRLTRGSDGVVEVEPPVAALEERFGVVWASPRAPRVPLLESADDADPQYAQGWLVPDRSASPAGVLAENFLDVAHFPFVHAGTFGAAEEPYVEPFEVTVVEVEGAPQGIDSTQDQWFDNPEDPGVVEGIRSVRQRRRATYTYRWPFQLQLRLEELDAGAVKTILFFLQPEDGGSTRIYTKMLLHGIGGIAVPGEDVVANEVDFEVAVLAEDLQLQRSMTVTGLPLRMRDELHVRSDRSGVALRRVLSHHRSRSTQPSTEPKG